MIDVMPHDIYLVFDQSYPCSLCQAYLFISLWKPWPVACMFKYPLSCPFSCTFPCPFKGSWIS